MSKFVDFTNQEKMEILNFEYEMKNYSEELREILYSGLARYSIGGGL